MERLTLPLFRLLPGKWRAVSAKDVAQTLLQQAFTPGEGSGCWSRIGCTATEADAEVIERQLQPGGQLVVQQPQIEMMADVRQQRAFGLQQPLRLLRAGQIVVVARRLRLRRQAAIEHQQIQRHVLQIVGGGRRQAGGGRSGRPAQRPPPGSDSRGLVWVLQRQRGDAHAAQLDGGKGASGG